MCRFTLRWSMLLTLCLSFLAPLLAQSTSHRQFVSPFTQPLYTGNNSSGEINDIATGDLDGDGKPDLVVSFCCVTSTPGPYLKWFKGNGDGTYTEKPIANALNLWPQSLVLADVNGDGRLDLIAATGDVYPDGAGELDVYLGRGDGTFQSPQRYLQGSLTVLFENGGAVSNPVIADLNGDGKPDLAVLTYSAKTFSVQPLLNKGDGTFQVGQPFTESASPGISALLGAGDFNGDRKTDLLVLDSGGIRVLTNNGEGVFSSGAAYSLPDQLSSANHAAAVLDVNHDGRPDVVLALQSRALVLLGKGDGTFRSTTSLQKPLLYPASFPSQVNVVAGDFNDDGHPDFIVGPYLYLGRGDGYFAVSATYATTAASWTQSTELAADLNGDGHLDLIWAFQSIYFGP